MKTLTDGSTIKANRNVADSFKVTIAGNRTIQLLNLDDGESITIVVTQASPGNFNLTWEAEGRTFVWASGGAPRLKSAVGASDTFTFIREGSNVRQLGAIASLLKRITDAPAMAVSYAIGATALTLALMANAGGAADISKTPDIARYLTGSGCTLLLTGTGSAGPCSYTRIDRGSGSILLSASGAKATGLAFGVSNLGPNSKITDGLAYITNNGKAVFSGATITNKLVASELSGATLTVTGLATSGPLCKKADGTIGTFSVSASGTLVEPLTCN